MSDLDECVRLPNYERCGLGERFAQRFVPDLANLAISAAGAAGAVDHCRFPSRPGAPRAVASAAMKTWCLSFALLLAASLRGADALPLFNATLTVGREHRFVLVDAGGRASSFLPLGDSFAGYKLLRYDAKAGVLVIERDGREHALTLVADAATKEAPAAAMPATIADAEGVLNKMHFEEMMERVLTQQKKMIAGQFDQVTKRMIAQGVDPADAAALQKKMTEEVMSALDVKQLKSDMSKVYSEVFTKTELDQIGAFFTTPLGEMLTAKQPLVQEKLGAIVAGRMSEVMPRVQKMGAEFAAAQKAKREAAGATAPAKK